MRFQRGRILWGIVRPFLPIALVRNTKYAGLAARDSVRRRRGTRWD